MWVTKAKVGKYLNLPISFDIETTSTVDSNDNKLAFMYCWQINFNGEFIFGRTWLELAEWYIKFVKEYNLSIKRRAVIYVHNLSFEFQFIRQLFDWEQVFALKERKVVYAVTKQGVEFRCSYILTNKSLANLAGDIKSKDIKKLVGDLDYSIIRHSNTPLTDEEMDYCRNDVDIVTTYIKEQIEKEGDITKIPLTATGYVRRNVKNRCFKNKNYRTKIKKLKLDNEEYKLLKKSFAGGFTHANASHSGITLYNVRSYDFTSAYPAVILSEQFPMSSGIKINEPLIEEFLELIKKYCCVFEITFTNITRKSGIYEDYLSASKCEGSMLVENNGRVNSAMVLSTVITDVDFKIITKVYDFDDFKIGTLYYYYKDYLPLEILQSTVEFYKLKTELKGVEEREDDYLVSKGMLNSIYGMMVTDINRAEIIYVDDIWSKEEPDIDNCIEKYNKGTGRFLHYPWGVWITAYNRYNLWSAIIEAENDYVYSDTDSIKLLNYEKHLNYFNDYNNQLMAKIKLLCMTTGIEFNDLNPKDIKGKNHLIGVWDDEGLYNIFKTLGAKRYMTYKEELSLTISGVNKKTAIPWLKNKFGTVDRIFEEFNNGLVFPCEASGKLTHTYLDNEMNELITDYLGNQYEISEASGVYLEPAEYSLTISEKYLDFIKNTQITR